MQRYAPAGKVRDVASLSMLSHIREQTFAVLSRVRVEPDRRMRAPFTENIYAPLAIPDTHSLMGLQADGLPFAGATFISHDIQPSEESRLHHVLSVERLRRLLPFGTGHWLLLQLCWKVWHSEIRLALSVAAMWLSSRPFCSNPS